MLLGQLFLLQRVLSPKERLLLQILHFKFIYWPKKTRLACYFYAIIELYGII
jgi:hypothetical protein